MSLTPSPENAGEIAEMVVPFVLENYGVTLDYSVSSLSQIERVIDDLKRDQPFEAVQPLLFSVGCYVGEVLVRHAGATWRTTESLGMGALASAPIVIAAADGRGCNPIGKVYKRFASGPAEDLGQFYRVVAQVAPAKVDGKVDGERK
jgi:hypothetical protein